MKKDIHLESLVPDLISENIYFNNPKFRQLIEAFLRYLEQRNESTLYINKLVDLRNVDEVLLDFISHLEYELGPSIPANNIGDKALYLKRLKELYISRGTTASIEGFFKLFYNTLIEIDFPFDSVLIPSSGNFDEAQYINQTVVESQDFSSIDRLSDTAVYRVDRDNTITKFYGYNDNLELVTALSLEGYNDLTQFPDFIEITSLNVGDYQNAYVGDYVYEGDPYYYTQTDQYGEHFLEITFKLEVGQETVSYSSYSYSNYFSLVDYTDFNTPGYALILRSSFLTDWNAWVAAYGSNLYNISLKHKLYKKTDEINLGILDGTDIVPYEVKEYDLIQSAATYRFYAPTIYYTFFIEEENGDIYTEGVTGTNSGQINISPTSKTPRTLYLRSNELSESQFKKKLNIVTSDNYEFPAIPYDQFNFDIDTARLYVNGKFLPRVDDRTVNWTYDYKAISGFPGGANFAFDAEPRLNIQFTTNRSQEELLYTYTVEVVAASVLDAYGYYRGTISTPFHTLSYGSIYSISVNGLELTFDLTQPYDDNSWRYDFNYGQTAESVKDIDFYVKAADVDPTETLTFEIVVVGRIELFYTDPDTTTNNFNNYIYNFDALSSDSIINIGDTTLEKGIDYRTIYREATKAKQFELKEKSYAAKFYKDPNTVYDSVTGKYTVEINTPFLISDPEHIIKIEVEYTDADGEKAFVEIAYNSTIGTNDSWGFDPSVADNRDKIFMTLLEGTIDPNNTVQNYGAINVTIVYYSEYGEVIEFIQNDPNNQIDAVNDIIGNDSLPLTITKQIPAYLDNKGFLSDDTIVLQDSYKYQLFSYILRTSINPTLWDNAYKQLINPAGFLYFTEVLLIVYGIQGLLESGKLLPDSQPGSQQGDLDYIILIPDFNLDSNAVPEKFDYETYVYNTSYSGDTGFLYTNSNLIGPYDYFDADKFTSFSGIGEFSNYTIQDAINNNIDVNSLSEITFS